MEFSMSQTRTWHAKSFSDHDNDDPSLHRTKSQASYPHHVEMECITSHKRAADMRKAGFCENESCDSVLHQTNSHEAIFITKKRNSAFRRHTHNMRKVSLIIKTAMQLCPVKESHAKLSSSRKNGMHHFAQTGGRHTGKLASMNMRAVIQSYTEKYRKQAILITTK